MRPRRQALAQPGVSCPQMRLPPRCFRLPSPAACPNRRGSPNPTGFGPPGGFKATSLRLPRTTPPSSPKLQEDAGIDIVADGEQARQHFVHGFLEAVDGIDFDKRVEMGIRNNRYKAMCPTVTGEVRLRGRVHAREARVARAHTKRKLKFTLPGPMTIVDTIADAHYGDRVKMAMAFADLLNAEIRGLADDGVDVIQFDEPAFNVYMDEAATWGIEALHRAVDGVAATSAVHICYGYGIPANIQWKESLGDEWRQYEKFFPALAKSRIDQVSIECINSRVPMSLLVLLAGKDVLIGAIDVATDRVETAEEVAAVIAEAARHVPLQNIIACTNCGMAPVRREIAVKKLEVLAQGAALARKRFAG
jgi:5-methyltetrahydropteroyltriglutamate--homocysteine methyltransferase